jgi:lysophospholipid acyltransferase (LPLAT)-like uncharacterized protein
MKIRHRGVIRLMALLMSWLIRAWLSTLNYKIVFPRGYDRLTHPRDERFICALWHESLLAGMVVRTKVHALISQHADGELIAQVIGFLGYGAARGSTTRGGAAALGDLSAAARHSHILVTPDGPRGPRRQFQAGTIYLASRTGLPMIFIGVGFSCAWRARSWDRFAVPLPWSTVYNYVSEPVIIPPDITKARRNELRAEAEELFCRVTAAAEAWAAGGPRPSPLPMPQPETLRRRAA